MSLLTAGREALAALYLDLVGYDPTVDDPSMTTRELRELVRSYLAERAKHA